MTLHRYLQTLLDLSMCSRQQQDQCICPQQPCEIRSQLKGVALTLASSNLIVLSLSPNQLQFLHVRHLELDKSVLALTTPQEVAMAPRTDASKQHVSLDIPPNGQVTAAHEGVKSVTSMMLVGHSNFTNICCSHLLIHHIHRHAATCMNQVAVMCTHMPHRQQVRSPRGLYRVQVH